MENNIRHTDRQKFIVSGKPTIEIKGLWIFPEPAIQKTHILFSFLMNKTEYKKRCCSTMLPITKNTNVIILVTAVTEKFYSQVFAPSR